MFVLRHERGPVFKFTSIQSQVGKELLRWCGLPDNYSEAVVLIDHRNVYLGSTAALEIGKTLKFPWSTLSGAGLLVARFIRDGVYDQVGRHRYQLFGKRHSCMVPTEQLKARFL